MEMRRFEDRQERVGTRNSGYSSKKPNGEKSVAMEEGEDVTPAREEPRRSRSSQVASSPVVRP